MGCLLFARFDAMHPPPDLQSSMGMIFVYCFFEEEEEEEED